MADRMLMERLQPSLLDRLTDDAPGERKESASARVIDLARLRQIILRDLEWLLNTSNSESERDYEHAPHAAASTLNYGIRELTGATATVGRALEIQRSIRKAIETFEPRILPETLDVILRQEKVGAGALISFDIRGELWAEPVPIDLYLRTALDVTTGHLKISRQG
ncbi:type VI secretion system baseplate subunit TssE [Albimonas pacifica]|uniref:Type VI secretion system protein ImpF n=1 Tax=Albimonas pacifica TaxID=1114924 RepID=A0A1I3CZ22_9RHOB|nr:type VI secretion system baseplate subunit TssE [Albimonas pacifica]SFH79717.1 type VI secretion system protein ImpF [Albimonas pacifica]